MPIELAFMRDRAIERNWVERLVRGLGCECPPEVFDQIRRRDLGDEGFDEVLEIGARLLVAVVDAERIDEGELLLEKGRERRDADGLNRFRLVFVGRPAQDRVDRLRELALKTDERLHVHVLIVEELRALL